jgi:hypothetical protein
MARGFVFQSGGFPVVRFAAWRCQKTQPLYTALNRTGTHMMPTSLVSTGFILCRH